MTEAAARNRRLDLLAAVAAVAVATAGVEAYLGSERHSGHDPNHALQQLDAAYLDEPAPAYRQLALQPGRPALVVFCEDCRRPDVDAQVRLSDDRSLARRYGLVTEEGRLGPGYAVIDPTGSVRYRTFDPGLSQHEKEIEILLDAFRS